MIWLILLDKEKTISLRNDNDPSESFEKTLPNPTLIQMKTRGAIVRQVTVNIFKAGDHQRIPEWISSCLLRRAKRQMQSCPGLRPRVPNEGCL